MRTTRAILCVLVASLGACDTTETTGPTPEVGDPLRGLSVFRQECASCHASGDGFDLAVFSFPDSTIVRRALAHVSEDDALDIVAHVRTLDAHRLARHHRLFQPGEEILADDVAFARRLFGEDDWPADLTAEGLAAIDPRDLPVALSLPMWSVEGDNVDWMPDAPLDDGILDAAGARERLDAYRRAPSDENLVRAVAALRASARSPDSPSAPCPRGDDRPVDYARCFEVQRWISTLAAQHMLRTGRTEGLHPVAHDAFWDVGQTVRRSIVKGHLSPPNGLENWVNWQWTGWIFEPERHASVYLGSGLARMGLARHAVFMSLRSMVARPPSSPAVFQDARNAARFAPAHWVEEAVAFGFDHLIWRLENAATLGTDAAHEARDVVLQTYRLATAKDPGAASVLAPRAERALALLSAS